MECADNWLMELSLKWEVGWMLVQRCVMEPDPIEKSGDAGLSTATMHSPRNSLMRDEEFQECSLGKDAPLASLLYCRRNKVQLIL